MIKMLGSATRMAFSQLFRKRLSEGTLLIPTSGFDVLRGKSLGVERGTTYEYLHVSTAMYTLRLLAAIALEPTLQPYLNHKQK